VVSYFTLNLCEASLDLRSDIYMARETRHEGLVRVSSPFSVLSYESQGVLKPCSMDSVSGGDSKSDIGTKS
jgi:hypothetical protein